MTAFRERMIRIFYPNRCVICDRALPPGPVVCEDCTPKLLTYPKGRKAVCPICGFKEKDCTCGKWRYYDRSVFPVYFEGDMRRSVHAFKFNGRLDKAKPLAALIIDVLHQRDMLPGIDCITYVPMGKNRLRKRGYNQAQQLAHAIGKETGLPVDDLLYKCQNTPSQHDQNAIRRQGNLLGVYEPYPDKLDAINGKRILLTDDIITTGATLNEAAKTLLIFGAKTVYVCAAAGRRRQIQNPKASS